MIKFVLIVSLFLNCAASAKDASFVLKANAYLLENTSDKKLIFSKNEEKALPVASLIKLFPGYIAGTTLPLNQYLKVISTNTRRFPGEKSALLKKDDEYTADAILKTYLLSSTNPSGETLAIGLDGDESIFKKRLSAFTEKNGLKSTSFADLSGLSAESKTSVKDLSFILDKYKESDYLFTLIQQREYEITEKNGKKSQYVSTLDWTDYHKYSIFGKTGTTKAAGKCFAGFISGKGGLYKVILIGSSDVYADLKNIINGLP